MTPRGVVFDFGNVLYRVDYPRMARALAGERAEEFLRFFEKGPAQVAYESGELDLGGVVAAVRDAGFPVAGREAFLRAYVAIFEPVAGMRRLVRALAAAGVPLGLLSNTSPEHASLVIERTPERGDFAATVYSFEVGCMKPAPRIYEEMARRLGAQPGELLFVDDLPENVEGARRTGMAGIVFAAPGDLAAALRARGLPLPHDA